MLGLEAMGGRLWLYGGQDDNGILCFSHVLFHFSSFLCVYVYAMLCYAMLYARARAHTHTHTQASWPAT